jgi:sec-independent protein translocase protein TatB|tara:strand:- start:187 stop:420 length:234 start_codon:yes stop_codon:yes gene_type:complete
MPTIGWFEILIVVVVAIIVIGPKDFPFMLKKAGSWIGTAKRYIVNIQNEVADLDLSNNDTEIVKSKVKEKNKNNDKI